MRIRHAAAGLVLLAAAGCTSGGGSTDGTAAPTTTAPSSAPSGGTTAAPPASTTTQAPAQSPAQLFADVVRTWHDAQTTFFTTVTSGKELTLAQEHAAAAAFLKAEQSLYAAAQPGRWPAKARTALSELQSASRQMQGHLRDMTQTASQYSFTGRLADYGVDVARNTAAIQAVTAALNS